ncbi:glycosyltransferase [Metabacillus halosaccharovorans]|uniref:glycosyltransferase n=1 Tax=Metabacillus halosaccharovorans TaxID=930124 RepID=UPI001C1FED7C|nr:glycosyltransferase [Metabacillus halosaccharovorans]MBU7594571.1 glycosyltransferase [Metabacillus halosaccharovorans]
MNKGLDLKLDQALEFFKAKDYYRAYSIIFDELKNSPNEEKIIYFLAAFAFATGNNELAHFYIDKVGREKFYEFINFNNSTLLDIMLSNKNEHAKWDNYRRPRNTNEINRFGVTAPFCKGDVLEIGCANGDLSSVIAMHADNHYGLDIDPIAIELARYKIHQYGLDNCYFTLGDGTKLTYSDNSFDTVVLAEVLEHVPDPKPFIEEAVRVCKPGGTLLISVPKGYSIPDPDHVRIFTKNNLEDLVKDVTEYEVNWVTEVPSPWLFCQIKINKEDNIKTKVNKQDFLPIHELSNIDFNEKVSIIIPTYNRSQYLVESLESVLAQTYPNKEIIIVNDGSDDNTEDVLAEYMDKITYITKENGGKSSAINKGMKVATGDYIWIFDDDDIALPKKLEVQIRKFQNDKNIGLLHTSAIYFTDFGYGRIHTGMWNPKDLSENGLKEQLKGNHFFTPSVVVKKECYLEVGQWDEELVRAQDYDMWTRISRYYKSGMLPIPTLHYRTHSGPRGSKQERISADNVKESTLKYHRLVVKKIHSLPIENVFPNEASDAVSLIESYMERAWYLLKNNLFDECLSDIESAKTIAIDSQIKFVNFSSKGLQLVVQLAENLNRLGDARAITGISYFLQMIKKANIV